ncbi:hypothetical protein GC098_24515 [Paenibacillus sp. LMG 31458]|uniref:Uncharacterized protein n=1 Tax=Paenibacillus phytorum TaxID=2654977 RepID=A0ABX1Y105_9BACL|nr:hypothetical protein [Paenibacillus phytorum]NOU74522.1 hypothetical protein [Paenibacillus phytorum]
MKGMPKPFKWVLFFVFGAVLTSLDFLAFLFIGSPVPSVNEHSEVPTENEINYEGSKSKVEMKWWSPLNNRTEQK